MKATRLVAESSQTNKYILVRDRLTFFIRSPYVYTVYWHAQASSAFLLTMKVQLTDWQNAKNMGNTTCADTKISHEWPYHSIANGQ